MNVYNKITHDITNIFDSTTLFISISGFFKLCAHRVFE